MMIMMQQLQKSQIQNANSQNMNVGGSGFNLGAQLPHHNRSESAAAGGSTSTPASGGILDRQMIDFMSAKHHNMSLNHHPQERKPIGQSSTP
jgi:hypothetical protein